MWNFAKRKTTKEKIETEMLEAEADLLKTEAKCEYYIAMNRMMVKRVKRLKEQLACA